MFKKIVFISLTALIPLSLFSTEDNKDLLKANSLKKEEFKKQIKIDRNKIIQIREADKKIKPKKKKKSKEIIPRDLKSGSDMILISKKKNAIARAQKTGALTPRLKNCIEASSTAASLETCF